MATNDLDLTDNTCMLTSDATTSIPSNETQTIAGSLPKALPVMPIPFAITHSANPATQTSTLVAPLPRPVPAKRRSPERSPDESNEQNDKKAKISHVPAHTKALIDFMRQAHLEQYTEHLLAQGYDDLNFMSTLSKKDLQSVATLVKMLPGHAAKFVAFLSIKVGDTISQQPSSASSACAGSATSASTSDSSYVVCIVDRSGSMQSMGEAVKKGFNEFIEKQKAEPGECMATIVRFDDEIEVVQHGVSLSDVLPATDSTFEPRGQTALFDAIGGTIKMVKKKISTLASKPKRVMALVLTDGAENASTKYSHKKVMKTIGKCEKKLNWTFVFVGANQDAIATGTKLGFQASQCLSYTSNSHFQQAAWKNVSANFSRQRAGGSAGWTRTERNTSLR